MHHVGELFRQYFSNIQVAEDPCLAFGTSLETALSSSGSMGHLHAGFWGRVLLAPICFLRCYIDVIRLASALWFADRTVWSLLLLSPTHSHPGETLDSFLYMLPFVAHTNFGLFRGKIITCPVRVWSRLRIKVAKEEALTWKPPEYIGDIDLSRFLRILLFLFAVRLL